MEVPFGDAVDEVSVTWPVLNLEECVRTQPSEQLYLKGKMSEV